MYIFQARFTISHAPIAINYFVTVQMFADHASSANPIDVPRGWIWNLPRRPVYFGTSVTSIFRGKGKIKIISIYNTAKDVEVTVLTVKYLCNRSNNRGDPVLLLERYVILTSFVHISLSA